MVCALDDVDCALESHAGVDVLGWEVAVSSVCFCVVLDEDEVPEFDAEV